MLSYTLSRRLLGILISTAVLLAPLGISSIAAQGDDPNRPAGWNEDSHGDSAAPDYATVFPQDSVNEITITTDPDTWQAMLDNMTDLYGEAGSRAGMGGPGFRPSNDQPPAGMNPPDGAFPQGGDNGQPPAGMNPPGGELPQGGDNMQPPGGMNPPGGAGGGGLNIQDENPMWAAATVEFAGQTWTHVGIRFKGNSSLASSWGSGILKLPFKLDFDQFEDDYPEIKNQRFYGFKQLSFSSNFSDDSLLREKVTADIFREAGVPSAQTAFYAVFVNYGEGPIYFGLYTAVELVDDTVIQTQFDDNSGNVYKPEGTGATFAEGSFDEASFEKETNAKDEDWSDIQALFSALHSDLRTTDPAAWRSGLEAVFDVDGFLNWLAVNTLVQNWDTYGSMAHNYYLYNDPTTGKLTWIPWDNNMAQMSGGMGRRGGGSSSLDLADVSDSWPLIRYLLDDEVYFEAYAAHMTNATQVYDPDRMAVRYQALHDMIAPYVVGEQGEIEGYTLLSSPGSFDTALTSLIEHVAQRHTLAEQFLAQQSAAQ